MRRWVPTRENWKTKFMWTIKHQAKCVVLYYYFEHLKILTCYSWKDNWWNVLKRCFVFICRWLTLKFLRKICIFTFLFRMLRLIFWILVFLFLCLVPHSLEWNMKNLLHLHLPHSHYCTLLHAQPNWKIITLTFPEVWHWLCAEVLLLWQSAACVWMA